MLLEIRERQGSGQKDPRLAFRAVQFRRDDEFGFGQRLRFAKMRASAIRQQVSTAVAARPADAIRVGPCQQYSGPIRADPPNRRSRAQSRAANARSCAPPESWRGCPP